MKKAADKSKPSRQELLNELTEGLEQAITEFMDGDTYKDFLSKMSRFHSYSLNNQILIATQRPDATLCASYTTWKSQGRQVKKGESLHGYYDREKKEIAVDSSLSEKQALKTLIHEMAHAKLHNTEDIPDHHTREV